MVLGADLTVGKRYIGDVSGGPELDGMEFQLIELEGPYHDMADSSCVFHVATVEVGSETWEDITIPTDASYQEVAESNEPEWLQQNPALKYRRC